MQKLGFGLMRLPLTDGADPSSVDMKKLDEMVDVFLSRGFTYFDTAYMYHGGRSESAAREAIVARYPRDSFWLTSKLPTFYLHKKGDQERIFAEQLKRCGVEYFDNYLLHSLDKKNYETAEKFGSFAFVEKCKREGSVRRFGFSFHDKADVLDKILREHPEAEFVQLQINYLDWEDGNIQSRLCLETARRHGKKVIVMEPVKGGTLAKVPPQAEKLMRECHPDWSPASWALRFAAGQEGVSVVLSGMSTMEQLRENTSFMGKAGPLGGRERAVLSAVTNILKGGNGIACTACRYCTESCPERIAIPDYFSLYNELHAGGDKNALAVRYEECGKNAGTPADCIRCRRCEGVCPQHLEVADLLQKVSAAFSK